MAIAEIHVVLKPTLLDAQGATVLKALHQLGHTQVRNVRIGKYITLEVDDAAVGPGLQDQLDRMCRQLLSNPVIEDYEITINAVPAAGGATTPAGTLPPTAVPLPPAMTPLASSTTMPPTVSTMTPGGVAAASMAPAGALSPSEQLAAGKISPSTVGTPDPFAMDYQAYDAMPANEQLAIQELAWQKYGGWIRQQLAAHRAAWILCVGEQVIESGTTLDSLPDETRRDQLGATHRLVPWVFTQPTT